MSALLGSVLRVAGQQDEQDEQHHECDDGDADGDADPGGDRRRWAGHGNAQGECGEQQQQRAEGLELEYVLKDNETHVTREETWNSDYGQQTAAPWL